MSNWIINRRGTKSGPDVLVDLDSVEAIEVVMKDAPGAKMMMYEVRAYLKGGSVILLKVGKANTYETYIKKLSEMVEAKRVD